MSNFYETTHLDAPFQKVAASQTAIIIEVPAEQAATFDDWRLNKDVGSVLTFDDVVSRVNTVAGWRPASPTALRRRPTREQKPMLSSDEALSIAKSSKLSLIDQKTQTLIAKGFTFKGQTLSASQNAQLNWLGLFNTRTSSVYPIVIPNLSNTAFIQLDDVTDVEGLYGAAYAHVETYLRSGSLLKQQAVAATTLSQLDAVVDNRT